MFADRISLEQLYDGYISPQNWKPIPAIDDRAQWEAVKQDPRLASSVEAILRFADLSLEAEIDPLTATMYMDFMRNGDRQHYEESYFRRRSQFSHLVVAECLTNRGIYLDKIIDYIWAILGEVYWCVPAHNFAGQHEMVMHKQTNPWKADDPLPIPDDEYLDLFNCETAAILAEACYLLKPVLMEISPALYHLVHRQIEDHTFAKLEGPKLYGWYHGKNNWAAWCSHNLLLAACYVIEDKSRLISFLEKLVLPMDRFFDNLEDTGSCIEGPTYWVVSAGRLIAFIELVEARFRVDLGFQNDEKFRNFGEHILKLHIGDNKFVNFADGSLKIDLDHGLLSKYAAKIDAGPLANLIWNDVERVAQRKLHQTPHDSATNHPRQVLVHLARLLFWTPQVAATDGQLYDKTVWLEDMQVMIARERQEPGEGLTLSCIAGSNDPRINHHSHNDVGHFSVYLDGEPIIIDLGQGAYSKATFSESRYEMWHISSEGHNVPRINGLLQRAGVGANATDVRFSQDETESTLSFDAAAAYFSEPAGNRVRRRIAFDHARTAIEIEDAVDLEEGLTTFELPIYVSDRDVSIGDDGVCRLQAGDGKVAIRAKNLRIDRVDRVEITDTRHIETWGPAIRRLVFTGVDVGRGTFSLSIRREP
ncbi:heparinase II/III domain-containing protein [Consotaella aegiceratis]|uniref:heparinase II/III domain-containing protein n=1 Tax=Consotaella aegiceratis TaxID=3097961 RepID=UPI002F3F1425